MTEEAQGLQGLRGSRLEQIVAETSALATISTDAELMTFLRLNADRVAEKVWQYITENTLMDVAKGVEEKLRECWPVFRPVFSIGKAVSQLNAASLPTIQPKDAVRIAKQLDWLRRHLVDARRARKYMGSYLDVLREELVLQVTGAYLHETGSRYDTASYEASLVAYGKAAMVTWQKLQQQPDDAAHLLRDIVSFRSKEASLALDGKQLFPTLKARVISYSFVFLGSALLQLGDSKNICAKLVSLTGKVVSAHNISLAGKAALEYSKLQEASHGNGADV